MMKESTRKMMAAAVLMTLFVVTACAEKDHMEMETMEKARMGTEMKKEAKMMDMDQGKEMPKKMDSEMVEPMEDQKKKEMDTMKEGMDSAMNGEKKKME
jgi:hypothetical protein